MKKKSWTRALLAYLLWAITLALGVWFGLISRSAFQALLGAYFIKETNQWLLNKQAIMLDRTFTVFVWLALLVVMILSEEYYRRGARSGELMKRFARFTGPLLLLVFLADFIILIVQGFSTGWLRWLLLVGELTLGILLCLYGRSFQRSKTTRRIPDIDDY